ncbi:MAG: glycosyltransferase family 4 protein [Nitrospirae bacterium]|jgi:glycosyltransferase involved in cell wall biosynthesis|nr:glycosyltransferase family 4 protein [Nitrospirota bacterium]
MKILHLLYESDGDYFGTGGVCTRAYEIYNYLKNNHDITLLCRKYPGALDSFKNGLRHFFVGNKSKSFLKSLLSYAYCSTSFVRENGKDFDIIIKEFSPAVPSLPKLVTKTPIVLQIQGYTGRKYFRKYNPLYAISLVSFEQIIPSSYNYYISINKTIINKFRFLRKKYIEIIPNGISKNILSIPIEDGEYILFIGRIDIYGKGLDLLLKAFEKFNSVFPDIKLIIAGNGRDFSDFKKLLMNLPSKVRNKIELPGWVTGEVKHEIFKKALFVIAPSRYEVQSISVLEAMAYGKPVITSDIQEFYFIKESGAGIQFKTGDYKSLFNSMKQMAESIKRFDMGKKGQKWVSQYTWDKIAIQYENYLKKVCY